MIEMIIIGISNIACFIIGASIRQKVDNKVEIKAPNVSRMIDNRRLKKEEKIKQDNYYKVLDNVNNYPNNQQEVK